MNYYALDESLAYIEVINEDGNKDLAQKMTATNKVCNDALKEAKKLAKQHDYKAAKAKIKEATKAAKELRSFADNMKEETNSSVIGYWYAGLYRLSKNIVTTSIVLVSSISAAVAAKLGNGPLAIGSLVVELGAGIVHSIRIFNDYQKESDQMMKNYKKDKDGADTYNQFRAIGQIHADKLVKKLEELEKLVDETEKVYKKKQAEEKSK